MKTFAKRTCLMLAGLFCMTLLFGLFPGLANAEEESLSDDIVILYTNDVHSYIDGVLSYDVIGAIKASLKEKYQYVYLADAGDHVQGTAYGSMDEGKTVIELMNGAGYDVATLGNHEFDYGMSGCKNVIEWAQYPYVSCNFYHESDGIRGENVLDSYVLFDCGTEKLAFVGITTPETISKSTPAYFQDENGNFIYGISGGSDGAALHQDVQQAIDEAKAAGATMIIGLGHLGVDPSSAPWTSEETIAGIGGLNAFIDGHSHTQIQGKNVHDKEGNPVLLTQTGEYFGGIGMMVIDSETGKISTDFIEYNEADGTLTGDLYGTTELLADINVKALKDDWLRQIDEKLGQKIGTALITLDNYDEAGNRLVRSQETNSGDFAADAIYYLFDDMGLDVDVAVMNGGGIRNYAITGDISYKTCKDMHPFGNVACLQTVTGQQILDMLEWSARYLGAAENGSLLHVAGLTYQIDTSIPDTTKADQNDVWLSGPEVYRVSKVQIYNKDTDAWEPLDLNASYNLAGYNYTLRDLGGGFAMLSGAVNVLDYVMEDYLVLANYISGFEDGIIDADNSPLKDKYPSMLMDYSKVSGSNRISMVDGNEPAEDDDHNDVTDNPQTGDEKGMTVLFAGVVIALSCLWIVGTFNRRKEA